MLITGNTKVTICLSVCLYGKKKLSLYGFKLRPLTHLPLAGPEEARLHPNATCRPRRELCQIALLLYAHAHA